jgi:hypothetical protein
MDDFNNQIDMDWDNYSSELEELIDNWDAFGIVEGSSTIAQYTPQRVYTYRDNPFIEALGDIMTEEEFYNNATYHPEIPDDIDYRLLTGEERIHLCMVANDFFEPFSQHAHLQQHISRTIRERYRTHNPTNPEFRRKLKSIVKEMRRYLKGEYPESAMETKKDERKTKTKMLGITLLGISGIGKTTAIEVILNMYDQVIYHKEYNDRKFTWTQVVYMKIDCPHDASIKGLCINFFLALDEILETRYFETHARFGLATVDAMIPRIAHLAFVHSIGILIIDEIQRLNYAKSGGASKVLSFFVQLINTVGMPIMLVGTPYARAVVSSHFRQIRRGVGSGKAYWENMDEDDEWDDFVKAMWKYQFTKVETPLTQELSHTLYYESAGIADLAVKLYIMAQTRAIRYGEDEIITEDLIRSVAYDALIDAQDMLNALRKKDYRTLEYYPDLMLVVHNRMLNIDGSPLGSQLSNDKNSRTGDQKNHPRGQKFITTPDKITALKQEFKVPSSGNLVDITITGKKHHLTGYDALKRSGYIKPALEFLNG